MHAEHEGKPAPSPFLNSRARIARILRPALLALAATLCLPQMAGAAEEKAAPGVVFNDDAKCTRCHDENESNPVLSIAKTRHGTRADGRLPSCTGCHGESDTHANKPQGKRERPAPTFPFGKRTTADVVGHNEVCESCHKSGKFIHWPSSIHAARDVPCTACHQMHVEHDKVKDRRTQPEVCFACHKEQRALAGRPSHHPILEGKVVCSDCHAAHGSAGPKLMQRNSVADTCFSCHMEKRGPFVRKHEPAEDCTICHNPHGTSTDNLLKIRPPFLCQQCHEPSSHQGRFAGMADGTSNGVGTRGLTNARSCLNCHTNIHGTNNPANQSNERTFRR